MSQNAGELSVRQAGRLGELTVLRNHNREFYAEIGELEQKTMSKV